MCLGGPNHCRVGWMGSQSDLFLSDGHLMLVVSYGVPSVFLL
jgi:hypothetical protein